MEDWTDLLMYFYEVDESDERLEFGKGSVKREYIEI